MLVAGRAALQDGGVTLRKFLNRVKSIWAGGHSIKQTFALINSHMYCSNLLSTGGLSWILKIEYWVKTSGYYESVRGRHLYEVNSLFIAPMKSQDLACLWSSQSGTEGCSYGLKSYNNVKPREMEITNYPWSTDHQICDHHRSGDKMRTISPQSTLVYCPCDNDVRSRERCYSVTRELR